jgi:hypothetical protein
MIVLGQSITVKGVSVYPVQGSGVSPGEGVSWLKQPQIQRSDHKLCG